VVGIVELPVSVFFDKAVIIHKQDFVIDEPQFLFRNALFIKKIIQVPKLIHFESIYNMDVYIYVFRGMNFL
jgi:hypothetical protein